MTWVRRRLQAYRRGLRSWFIDERLSIAGIRELMLFLPQQVERVEFIDRGTMVRVYTRRYVEDKMLKRAHPMSIVLTETPLGLPPNDGKRLIWAGKHAVPHISRISLRPVRCSTKPMICGSAVFFA